MEAKAEAKYVRVSPQKARLVVDLIRGRRAEDALNLLRFTRKRVAEDVAKVLQSAIANAASLDEEVDVDQLFVLAAYVNDGPRQKRIRPAPMGRAYRYQRRFAHIGVRVGDRPGAAAPVRVTGEEAPAAAPAARPRRAPAKAAARGAGKKPRPGGKPAGAKTKKNAPARGGKAAGRGARPTGKAPAQKGAAPGRKGD